ncbi:hypothetical protein ACWOFR_00835 [Carnobacterium gallinarum]|uniref:hypothetical protein n=1 Tax=Carnobacterium gallinarum TaxID=2749 RepID=UPI0012FC75CC|nr:hypothetical protein [Carnobacterium gallinarum]
MTKRRKEDRISTGIESARRTVEGMPGGDPTSRTTWKDTLILIAIVIVLGVVYLVLK